MQVKKLPHKTRVVILTSKGGQGLISGSLAIQEALAQAAQLRGCEIEVEIIDFFASYSATGEWLTHVYNYLLRKSLLFSSLYVKLVHWLRPDRWRFLYGAPLRGFSRLLQEKNPDILIITSQYMVAPLAYALSRKKSKPLTFVGNIDPGTCCVPLWFDDDIDCHLIPTPEAMTAYKRYGRNPERAIPARLVVRRAFLDAAKREKAEVRRALGWDMERYIILFAGSREGYQGVLPVLQKTAVAIPDAMLVVICGTNNHLKTQIENWARREARDDIRAIGWCDHVHLLMRAADVIVAKPGKQTMKETVTVQTPWIALAFPAVMEQERGNLEFMRNRGIDLAAHHVDEVVMYCKKLRDDHPFRQAIQKKLAHAAADIQPEHVAAIILDEYAKHKKEK
jgi:UDP-N-acetylglucosamine:LPS N-acetylglucosamine transferase